jgi:hypothetical protein
LSDVDVGHLNYTTGSASGAVLVGDSDSATVEDAVSEADRDSDAVTVDSVYVMAGSDSSTVADAGLVLATVSGGGSDTAPKEISDPLASGGSNFFFDRVTIR